MRDTANQIERTVIHEETLPCDVPLDKLDMDWLRRRFSTLFDRAARAVNRAGYDLDDVVVERFILCGDDTKTANEYPLPSMTDHTVLCRLFSDSESGADKGARSRQQARLIGLRVQVVRESSNVVWG